jgi:predicted PurR-regulated permease PerM
VSLPTEPIGSIPRPPGLLDALSVLDGADPTLTLWLTSWASRMNPVTVFVGALAWGWPWGLWGLLLGVPILMAVKAVCDRVDDLKPIGEMLGS